MAISTGSVNLPAASANTRGVDTATLTAIRKDIQPASGWWQFEFQPWHYWTAITSTVVIFIGCLVLVGIGLHR